MADKMIDYILEQPEALKRVMEGRKEDAKEFVELLKKNGSSRIYLIGSGSSLNAAKAAAPLMEDLLHIEVTPIASSRCGDVLKEKSFLLFISQGGNSTNTVAAIKSLAECPHIALTGAETCAVNQIAAHVLIRCGEEKAGPKTKGYLCTMFLLYALALEAAYAMERITQEQYEERVVEMENAIERMPGNIQTAQKWMERNAQEMSQIEKCVIIGKRVGQAAAEESALKLQETMLIPASGYEYEEFLHGPNMAIDEKMAGLYLLPEEQDPDYERFAGLVRYHRMKSPFVYTVGGGKAFDTERDLPIGVDDSERIKLFAWCLPSQLMGSKLPAMTGKEGKGHIIFKELDAMLNIKAKGKA
ncbi:MAG: SIS domain-containing protein [Eubacteriales bacterium]|nr:SIS domain-containing protein [Eubacteriales bacterium]